MDSFRNRKCQKFSDDFHDIIVLCYCWMLRFARYIQIPVFSSSVMLNVSKLRRNLKEILRWLIICLLITESYMWTWLSELRDLLSWTEPSWSYILRRYTSTCLCPTMWAVMNIFVRFCFSASNFPVWEFERRVVIYFPTPVKSSGT